MGDLAEDLQALYEQVPATRCAQSGECCVLTADEFDNQYATMFPLYSAEYQNIVAYVKANFSPQRQEELLNFTEERPRSCPFLNEDHGCTIYPVRPLICRTYAVMNHQTIGAEAERNRGDVPEDWIRGFVVRESGMVCPRVAVTEPEKLEKHARNLMDSTYEQELQRLSRAHQLADKERKRLFQKITWRPAWPLRWTWGGFNSIATQPLDWIVAHFKKYWKKAELADSM